MKPNLLTPWRKQQAGLSLIELMVGLVIGILAMLVILQMYQVFEGQKRTTTTGGDAQENGLFAMTILERDVKMAGYGLSTNASLACTNYFTYIDTGAPTGPTAVPGFSTAAITITDGGASGSDSLLLRSAITNLGPAPGSLRAPKPQTSAELDVTTVFGLAEDDFVLIVQGGNCMLVQLTQIQPTARKVQHNPGGGQATPSNPRYNPPGSCYQGSGFCSSWPAFTTGALLFNIGQFETKTYSINAARSLQLIENGITTAPIAVASEIVFMKAQYGVSAAAAGSQTIIRWVEATNVTDAVTGVNWATPTAVDIRRIKAVRVAVVARSTQQEREIVSPATLPLWPSDTMTDGESMTLATTAERQFRYKVYQTIIPLRNVMWTGI